jgi:hypothetical protein
MLGHELQLREKAIFSHVFFTNGRTRKGMANEFRNLAVSA